MMARCPQALQQLGEQLNIFIRLETLTKILIWIVVFISIVLCQMLLYKAGKQKKENQNAKTMLVIEQATRLQMPIAVGMALANYAARFQFGDVQHLFVLTFVPFVILRWLNYAGVETDKHLAIATGLFAGLGVSLDLCFWPIMLVNEIILLSHFKCRPQGKFALYGLLGGLMIALVPFLLLSSIQKEAFLKWMMPLRVASLTVFDQALIPFGNTPDRRDFIYLISAAVIVATPLCKRLPLYQALIGLTLCGLFLSVREGQGLSYQLVIGAFSGVLLLTVAVLDLLSRWRGSSNKNILVWSIFLTLVSSLIAAKLQQNSRTAFETTYALPVSQTKDNLEDLFPAIEKLSKWKDNVMLFSYSPNAMYPILNNLERRQSGYLLWSEPFYLLTQLEERGPLTEDLNNFRKMLLQKLQNDISSGQAKIILVDQMREEETLDKYKLKKILDDTYDYTGNCLYYSNFQEPRENIGMALPFLIYEQKNRPNPAKSKTP